MTKIWQRYFIKEILKVFFLIITLFYGLYILIDYASHSSRHIHHTASAWIDTFRYYSSDFIQRIDVLAPFALLIASIRTLSLIRSQNELTALLTSGLKLHTSLRPFVFLGLLFTALIYLNTEYFVPYALTELRHMHDHHSQLKNQKNKSMAAKRLALKDNTTLLFQNYDPIKQMFFDVYWIKSTDEIYRIKYLYPYTKAPTAEYVDFFIRNQKGELTKSESFEKKQMPELHFNKKNLLDTLTLPEELPLSVLWKKHSANTGKVLGEKEASLEAVFFRKLAIPWFCLLAVIAPAPFCIRFSRNQSTFFIYAIGIFSLVTCFLIIDAAWVLAERQVFSPGFAIGLPFVFLMAPPLSRFLFLK
jgi:lipopolysaccharide export system permease protein